MRPDTVLLFPGQGGYVPGALHTLIDGVPSAGAQLALIDSVSRGSGLPPVSSLLTDPASPSLGELVRERTERLDLVLFASAIANDRVLHEIGLRADILLGHSFGELAALTVSGALSVADAARLAGARARALRETRPAGGMAALAIDARRAEHLAGYVDRRGLTVAVDNGPEQCVISGGERSLAELERVARAIDVSFARLPAAYPFHSRLMRGHAAAIEDLMDHIDLSLPQIPVYSCILGHYIDSIEDIRSLLTSHLARPVRFYDGLLRVHRDGGRAFVEVGNASVLTPVARRCLPPGTIILTAPADRDDAVSALREGGVPLAAAGPAQPPPNEDDRAATAPPPADVSFPDQDREEPGWPGSRAELLGELRAIYARLLDVPEDLLSDDVDLEADLGVDSIKQAESFAHLQRRYRLDDLPGGARVTSYTTLPQIAGLVEDLGKPFRARS
ncbi:acyltransferase domain-containing protein [Amycolatopsis rubida]|uniref:Acyltransferase domain-containing protein n=1 Tax=Amycolatopsis rubida TaxID=112413 RepID=A0ABX0BV42_9PSEU|nr:MULTISPECIES: acyltransferase domain-containing protein [Amycolatopsis]MYW93803.1 acyltransferase domain-containing protein [Amycolatopsis rubida]NEC58793.1 acyltransferase domain-containing protein [Amycolatopsis rubida]OAP22994.1 Phenolphthiocerol synthesis polyketide synthase type I Pks15/1 [Amycolatopsis sp. M39]